MNPNPSIHFKISALLCASVLPLAAAAEPPAEPMSVWFTTPARSYHESCPLGNGRLGAMDLGGVSICHVVLNESSVWSGGPYEANRPDAHQCLPEAREVIVKVNGTKKTERATITKQKAIP